jgi:predicted 3-demethylubiquinone-9 3-methyltransferase (glyoxalase superfamily)
VDPAPVGTGERHVHTHRKDNLMSRITPNLWFDTQAEEAAKYYIDALGDGKITNVLYYGPDTPGPEGSVMTVTFELFGQTFTGINGGPQFTFNEAISLEVTCEGQEELDRVWAALVDGGEPGPCGWLKDRYGVSWQVTPTRLYDLLNGDDPAGVQRATQAMLATNGEAFDIAALEAAYAVS